MKTLTLLKTYNDFHKGNLGELCQLSAQAIDTPENRERMIKKAQERQRLPLLEYNVYAHETVNFSFKRSVKLY